MLIHADPLTNRRRSTISRSGFVLLCLFFANSAVAATPVMRDIDITVPRPLHEALFTIEQTLRVPVNFEEAPPVSQDELVSGSVYGLADHRLYQKGGRLTIHFVTNEKDALSAVQTTLAAYWASGLPGKYTVNQEGGMITVLPTASNLISNTRITIPGGERSIEDLFQLISDQLTNASGRTVKLMRQPFTDNALFSFSVKDEPFISVFQRLADLSGPISYRFIFDVPRQTFYLTISSVPRLPPEAITSPVPAQSAPASSAFFTKDKP